MNLKANAPGCNCCDAEVDPCATLCSGDSPATITVELTGFVDEGFPGDNCTGFNGTYVLVLNEVACLWQLAHNEDPCGGGNGFEQVCLTLTKPGSDYILTGIVETSAGGACSGSGFYYEKNLGTSQPDCESWSALDIPFDQILGTCCDGHTGGDTAFTVNP